MLRNGKEKCSCPHTDCKINGRCDECSEYHGKNMTYCQKKLNKESKPDKS